MFLRKEDAALKAKFDGLTVSDAEMATRPVTVRFTTPEYEVADVDFPLILIDPAIVTKADDREHRGAGPNLPYYPEGVGPAPLPTVDWDGNPTFFDPNDEQYDDVRFSPIQSPEWAIPYNLDYGIRVMCRKQSHLTQLVAKLAQVDRIPHRFGYVEVPETATVQSLDLVGGPELSAEKDTDGKRLFSAVYSVRVFTEFLLYDVTVTDPTKIIQQVVLDTDHSP